MLSINNLSWRFNAINTLVTDHLAYPILLGLTFLHDNKLIVNINIEIVVNKCNRYDFITSGSQETPIVIPMKKETKNKLDTKLSELQILNFTLFSFLSHSYFLFNLFSILRTRVRV